MNNYFLTDAGADYLYDRTRQFKTPVLFSSDTNYNMEQISGKSGIHTIKEYDIQCFKLHDRLLFIFDLPEDSFTVNYKSFIIGFKTDISRRSNSIDFQQLIYINSDNCYGGISEATGDEDIVEKRLEVSQLKYGMNTIIIQNVFPCSFLVNTLENDLIPELNSYEQLQRMYPYYGTI